MDKPWKVLERKVADKFGVERNARTGKNAGDLTEHPKFVIECKYRKNVPKLLLNEWDKLKTIRQASYPPVLGLETIPKIVSDGLEQANGYDRTKIPVLVLKKSTMHGEMLFMYKVDYYLVYADLRSEVDGVVMMALDDFKVEAI